VSTVDVSSLRPFVLHSEAGTSITNEVVVELPSRHEAILVVYSKSANHLICRMDGASGAANTSQV
jgi:hypothetical protein